MQAFGIKVILITPGAIESDWVNNAPFLAFKNSGSTNYAKMTTQIQNLFAKSKMTQAKAESVAKVILNAVKSRNPKFRYIVPFHAKLIWLARIVTGERFFDYLKRKILYFPNSSVSISSNHK